MVLLATGKTVQDVPSYRSIPSLLAKYMRLRPSWAASQVWVPPPYTLRGKFRIGGMPRLTGWPTRFRLWRQTRGSVEAIICRETHLHRLAVPDILGRRSPVKMA